MSSFDNDWFSFGGDARPGRVPGQVIVKGPKGYQLTAGQRGEFSQVFRQFGTSVKTSSFPDGFHSRNMTLADGSTVSMSAINGAYRSVITPVVGGGGAPPRFGGFLSLPLYADRTLNQSQTYWFIYDIHTGGHRFAPGYKAGTPPEKTKFDFLKWYHWDQIPGARSWDSQGLFPGRLNWRGPPAKYQAFGDYPEWNTYASAGQINSPLGLFRRAPDVMALHRSGSILWIDGIRKTTEVGFIFSACLHRPNGDDTRTVVRVFGTDTVGDLNGGAQFRVYDLTAKDVSPGSCTLADLKGASKLVVFETYDLPGDYETDAIFLPPQHVGNWKFLYAPEFDRLGNKMAAAISRRTFWIPSTSESPASPTPGVQGVGYFSSVCEVDPKTFSISNERWSHSVLNGTESTKYVGCDYLGDEFVTLRVADSSGGRDVIHSKHGVMYSTSATYLAMTADLAKDLIYTICDDPDYLTEVNYWARPGYSTHISHDVWFREKRVHLFGPSNLAAGPGVAPGELVSPPSAVYTWIYDSANGVSGHWSGVGTNSAPLYGHHAVAGNVWHTWTGVSSNFTWDAELGRARRTNTLGVIDGTIIEQVTEDVDTRPGGPYTPGLEAPATFDRAGTPYEYRCFAFTKDGDGVFLSATAGPYYTAYWFYDHNGGTPTIRDRSWFIRLTPKDQPLAVGEPGFTVWPAPDKWVTDTPRTPTTVHYHIAPVFI